MRVPDENAVWSSMTPQESPRIWGRLPAREKYSAKPWLKAEPEITGADPSHSRSENFLAEAGEDEFDAEKRRAVVLVEDGIDLDDLERNHGLGVGDHFHGEVGFAVRDAAAHGSADSGSVGRVDEIHIEADGDAGGGVPCAA